MDHGGGSCNDPDVGITPITYVTLHHLDYKCSLHKVPNMASDFLGKLTSCRGSTFFPRFDRPRLTLLCNFSTTLDKENLTIYGATVNEQDFQE